MVIQTSIDARAKRAKRCKHIKRFFLVIIFHSAESLYDNDENRSTLFGSN